MANTRTKSNVRARRQRLRHVVLLIVAVSLVDASARRLAAQDAAATPQSAPANEAKPVEAASVPAFGQQPVPNEQPQPAAEELARWITDLDSDQYLDRERATQQLIEAGASALDALLNAANSASPEPADRAMWILRRQGRSRNNDLAIAALEREVLLKGRPNLVQKAESRLAQRRVDDCKQRLAPLGADVSLQRYAIDVAQNVANVLHVSLSDTWHGTIEDLRTVTLLPKQAHFRLEGTAVDDATVKLFEDKENLVLLQLMNTKVSVAAVDSLKKRHPDAIVYLRNQALLGVQAEKHALGVIVVNVPPNTGAAAAGITPGDIITAIDGHKLVDFDRMTAHIAQHQPGDKIEIEIIRNEKPMKLPVTLGSWANQGG